MMMMLTCAILFIIADNIMGAQKAHGKSVEANGENHKHCSMAHHQFDESLDGFVVLVVVSVVFWSFELVFMSHLIADDEVLKKLKKIRPTL